MRRMKIIDENEFQQLGYYSTVNIEKKKIRTILEIGSLVFIWYFTAVITITTSKEIMNQVKLPFLLCTIQFIFASLLSAIYLYYTGQYRIVSTSITNMIYQISASYTLGFILTNWAFSIVAPAFAETVKSSEPISTVVIGWFFLNENVSSQTYLTLIPVCLGVGISCYHDEAFNLLGFLLAASSNFCFSSRAVLTKKMNLQYPDGIDDINMFCNISLDGLLLLVPITLLFEGGSILQLLQSTQYSQPMITPSDGAEGGALAIGNGKLEFNFLRFCLLLLLNGSLFAIYNLASYVVLRKTDLITHSVLNAFRRVFIIVFTTFYFQSNLSVTNLFGIFIAISGVILFGYFRSQDKKASN